MLELTWCQTFHLADLEPGAREKYVDSIKIITGIQKQTSIANTDWMQFCLEVLDSLSLKVYYQDFVKNPHDPWPHRYMAQDITQAFVMMALFFPNLEVTSIAKHYFDTDEGSAFKTSPLFNPAARAKQLPDRRTRAGNSERPKAF